MTKDLDLLKKVIHLRKVIKNNGATEMLKYVNEDYIKRQSVNMGITHDEVIQDLIYESFGEDN